MRVGDGPENMAAAVKVYMGTGPLGYCRGLLCVEGGFEGMCGLWR